MAQFTDAYVHHQATMNNKYVISFPCNFKKWILENILFLHLSYCAKIYYCNFEIICIIIWLQLLEANFREISEFRINMSCPSKSQNGDFYNMISQGS